MSPVRHAETGRVLFEFSDERAGSWRPINDGVMGGVSTGALRLSERGTGIFEGNVSFENGGGFASVRAEPDRLDLSAYAGIEIRVRGDGHRYRLRLHSHRGTDGLAYQADFHSGVGQWHEIALPFAAFVPTFRGRTPADAPPLDPATIEQIGLMIADRQAGPFRLEIGWIRAYGTATAYANTDN